MPQVVRVEKFLVLVYTEDHAPAHVHVRFGKCSLRVLITETTVTLDKKYGKTNKQDVRRAMEIVAENITACLDKWKEIHG